MSNNSEEDSGCLEIIFFIVSIMIFSCNSKEKEVNTKTYHEVSRHYWDSEEMFWLLKTKNEIDSLYDLIDTINQSSFKDSARIEQIEYEIKQRGDSVYRFQHYY